VKKFTEFFKGKGYYVLLFIGVIAIGAVAVLGAQQSSNQQKEDENIVDLNDTDNNIAAGESDTKLAENNPVSEGIVNKTDNSSKTTVTGNEDKASKASDALVAAAETAKVPEATKAQTSDATQAEEIATVETAGTTVQNEVPVANKLSFQAEDGLLWPVKGEILKNYSMDHTIFFETLMQYKCNPAVIIDAEVGAEVKAAADGIVSKIDADNEETGCTITMNIGDEYSVVYGQLDKDSVSLKVGDTVKEGTAIGTIADPTKYYSVEGSNLYFQVKEKDQSIDPTLLLR